MRAIKADPTNTTAMYNYANMLKHVFKDFDAAQDVRPPPPPPPTQQRWCGHQRHRLPTPRPTTSLRALIRRQCCHRHCAYPSPRHSTTNA